MGFLRPRNVRSFRRSKENTCKEVHDVAANWRANAFRDSSDAASSISGLKSAWRDVVAKTGFLAVPRSLKHSVEAFYVSSVERRRVIASQPNAAAPNSTAVRIEGFGSHFMTPITNSGGSVGWGDDAV